MTGDLPQFRRRPDASGPPRSLDIVAKVLIAIVGIALALWIGFMVFIEVAFSQWGREPAAPPPPPPPASTWTPWTQCQIYSGGSNDCPGG